MPDGPPQSIELVEGGVHRALSRRMSVGIERHDTKGLRERVEKAGGIAHEVVGETAARMSGSGDSSAAVSTAAA